MDEIVAKHPKRNTPKDKECRWVYIPRYDMCAAGQWRERDNVWQVLVMPDWMTDGFLRDLPGGMSPDGFFIYVQMVVPDEHLQTGEEIQSITLTEEPHFSEYYADPSDRFLSRKFDPVETLKRKRIHINGILVWGMEEYPGERRTVTPQVSRTKRLKDES
jgi:hypothetical protein